MLKVRIPAILLLMMMAIVWGTFPAVGAMELNFAVFNYIALGPDETDASSPAAEESNNVQPKSTPEAPLLEAAPASGVSATPKPVSNKRSQPTTTPTAGTTENLTTNNQDLLLFHSSAAPPPTLNPDFKLWLNHFTLRDVFALKDRFWAGIPFYAGVWAFFISLAVLFYLLKLKQLRQPLLFLSVIFFGFFGGGVPNPINGIFEVAANKQQALLDLVFILFPVGLSLVWGRFYCGWICPVGAIQEFLNPAPEERGLPQLLDRVLKYFKFITLIGIGYLSWHSLNNVWENYDLSRTLFTFSWSLTALIILGVILVFAILVPRPFCKYLCPLGAILVITSKFAPFRMRADAEKCMVCGKCRSGECPMDAVSAVNPEIDLPNIDNSECIKCFHCQKNCRKSALRVTGFKIDRVYFNKDRSADTFNQ